MMSVKDSMSVYRLEKSKEQFDAILNNLLKTNVKTGYTFAKLKMDKHPIHPLLFSVLIQSILESKPVQYLEPMISKYLNTGSKSANELQVINTWISSVIKKAHQQSQHYVNNRISNFVLRYNLELDQDTMDLLIDSLSKKGEYFKLKKIEVDDEFNLKCQSILLLCKFRNKLASSYHLINLLNDLETDFKYQSNMNSLARKYKQDQLNSLILSNSPTSSPNQKLADYINRKAKLNECFEKVLEYLLYRLDDEFAFGKMVENRNLTASQSTIVLKYYCKHKNIELIRKYYQPSVENTKIYFRYLIQNGLAHEAKAVLDSESDNDLKQELTFEYNIHQGNYYYHNDLQKRKLFRHFYRNQLYPQVVQLCSDTELITKEPVKEMNNNDYAKLIDSICIVKKDYSLVEKIIEDNNLEKAQFASLINKHFKKETKQIVLL
ncbi:hypothetical protein HK103_004605 [Boothiomyces macroporosus]|uniref:Uncharacterized protein n=1 Tax=Boothiomyces macroporosus TaxID=261099 RepID=A0AAD5UJ24_9FUNG|nr:hypothetical protein HK103_004605 [Boothiomyces macroporosus]